MQEQKPKPRASKRVIWDEQKLQETQKTRGMFQKIPQPKTPYVKNSGYGSAQQDNADEPKSSEEIEIDQNLSVAKHNQQINAHKKINLEELNHQIEKQLAAYREEEAIQEEEEEEKRKRQEEFKKKRASHYNEFQMIKQMKNHSWEDEEDQMG